MRRIKKIILILLVFTVASTQLYSATTFEYDKDYKRTKLGDVEPKTEVDIEPIASGFEQVSSNSKMSLYLNKANGNFAVVDLETNYVWYSNPQEPQGNMNDLFERVLTSPFNITYTNADFKEQQATMLDEESEFKINTTNQGIVYEQSYLNGEIKFKVIIDLDESGITITIPSESVSDSDNFQLLSISIAPYLGAVYEDELDGYFVIPYQNGTLLRFKESKQYGSSFIGTTTVSDFEKIGFPMFGGVHGANQNGFVTYISSDDSASQLVVKPSGYDTGYTSSNFNLTYRSVYSKQIGETQTVKQVSDLYTGTYTQEYQFLNGSDANYSGIANVYRQYLIESNQLSKDGEYSFETYLMYLMTLEDKALFGTKSADVSSYEEISELQNTIQDKGLHVLTSVTGIQEKGMDDIDLNDINKSIGEPKQANVSEGINYYLNLGILSSLERFNHDAVLVDPTTNKPMETNWNRKSVYLPTSTYVSTKIGKILDSLDENISSLTIQPPFRFFDLANQSQNYYTDATTITESLSTSNKDYIVDLNGNYYPGYYKGANGYISDFIRDGNGYAFLDEGVPFSSIVLAGSGALYSETLNYKTIDQTMILNMIEYDVYPNLQLTSGSQDDLFEIMFSESFPRLGSSEILEEAEEIEAQIYEPLSKVEGQAIEENYAIANGVKVTVYEDGTEIIVNYTNDDFDYNGITVKSNDYALKEVK